MSINRTIAAVSAIAITAVGLVACNDSEDKMDNKMDGSMTPTSSAMMSEEKMGSLMTPSSAMMEPSSAMMSEEKMTEESK